MAVNPEGRIYFLDLGVGNYPKINGRILSSLTDGSDLKELVTGLQQFPDGLAIDYENKHLYWTNMGRSVATNDGSIQRCDIETGENIVTIIPAGVTHTPKQLVLARSEGKQPKLYWSDREGMRVMRSNLDGSEVETLVAAGDPEADKGDMTKWCVGIAVDTISGKLYWTQKGPSKGYQGRILRAAIDLSEGMDARNRTDIDTFMNGLPEPVDLDIDHISSTLFWTDRGDPPFGNSVHSAKMVSTEQKAEIQHRILVRKLHEAIGLALDIEGGRMFMTDLLGSVYSANLDGSDKKVLHNEIGDCTGVVYFGKGR